MCEPKAFRAGIAGLLAVVACSSEPAPPPRAAVTEIPVAPATGDAPVGSEEDAGTTAEPDAAPPRASGDAPVIDPTAAVGSAPFDRGRAAAALGAISVQACARGGGPAGPGHIRLTFATNGHVRAAVLDQPPYPGTPVGKCIVARFLAATVPPFTGPEVTVGKSFFVK